jgi:hypothetical protein
MTLVRVGTFTLFTAVCLGAAACAACTGSITDPGGGDDTTPGGDDDPGPGDPPGDPIDPQFRVQLVPQTGVSGTQRVNLAIPLPPDLVDDASMIRVAIADGGELATARRALASWPDGSLRSVQLQVEVDVGAVTALDVEVGTAAGGGTLDLVDVASTLVAADGTMGPRVWALLPAEWLAGTGFAGPATPSTMIAGTELDAWSGICDYAQWNIDAFLELEADRGSWLYDRATAMYRGHAITGSQETLESAYREAAIYLAGISGTGSATRIGIPTAESDVKYHYTQNLALHYLMTGDDRFREAAENVAIRTHDLWSGPGYSGSGDFWTERNAGFALLAYEWAAAVSDDRASTFAGWSSEAVTAYLAMQDNADAAFEADARCFAHDAADHDEPYGYVGCSPWMSAILADGLDAYARRTGDAAARTAIVELGTMIARHGLDPDGRPYYWMGAGVDSNEPDEYDEHWGESAYIVAMAWHYGGRTDAALRTAAMALIDGLATQGEAGQLRSFNWQCRSAVLAPTYLRE